MNEDENLMPLSECFSHAFMLFTVSINEGDLAGPRHFATIYWNSRANFVTGAERIGPG